jgi:hypothetical protein
MAEDKLHYENGQQSGIIARMGSDLGSIGEEAGHIKNM